MKQIIILLTVALMLCSSVMAELCTTHEECGDLGICCNIYDDPEEYELCCEDWNIDLNECNSNGGCIYEVFRTLGEGDVTSVPEFSTVGLMITVGIIGIASVFIIKRKK